MNTVVKRGQLLFVGWVLLSLWGIINLYSASSIDLMQYGIAPYSEAIQNLFLFIVGLFIYFVTRRYYEIPYQLVRKNVVLINSIILITLILVLFLGVDAEENLGAKSVINLGFFMYQPMEFYKISMIMFFAHYFSKTISQRKNEYYITGLVICLFGIGLVFIEPDGGGALILMGTLFLLFLVNGEYIIEIIKWAVPGFILGVFGIFLLLQTGLLKAYQISRVSNWINPFNDAQGEGLQLIQSFIGISNGGVGGVGFLESTQKTGFLPFPSSDAIISIMLEEWGILALIITVGLIMFIAFMCFSIGFASEDRFDELYSYGVGILLLVQTFINIGGVTGTIPLTGVTLPLISYGKNSYVTLMLAILFVFLIDRRNEKRLREEKLKQEQFFR